ncbi:MAG: MBL fold metallo-hydrolase [Burkholderiales bacterium]
MRRALLALAAGMAVGVAVGCVSSNDGHFRNNYPHPEKTGFWKWKWDQWRDGLPRRPERGYRFETVQSDFSPALNPSVTWIGHATVLVRVGGLSVLTDPQFSERASPLSFAGPRRVVPPAPGLNELPHIDAVVISHNHYDHLDLDSVKKLAAQSGGSPRFFVPLGLKDWFTRRGIEDAIELGWWQSVTFNGIEVHFVPVQHWSKRTLTDENRTLWGGWVLRHPELSFFFAGDAGYSKDFADIGARFGGFDLAAFPIGAYEPRWFMKIMHMDPAEAVQAHKDVNARRSLAIHWGTFDGLTDESLYEPPQRLDEARRKAGLREDQFFVLKHGETRSLARQ